MKLKIGTAKTDAYRLDIALPGKSQSRTLWIVRVSGDRDQLLNNLRNAQLVLLAIRSACCNYITIDQSSGWPLIAEPAGLRGSWPQGALPVLFGRAAYEVAGQM